MLIEAPKDMTDPDPDNKLDEFVTGSGIFADGFETLLDLSL